ncbi:MAG: hypothetical protein FJZ56_00985 [Chlamydiae bacterium]|nr:hypothetical protein [Chlamydiota bacterium]
MSNKIFEPVPSFNPSEPENLKVQKTEKVKQQRDLIEFKELLISNEWVVQVYFLDLIKDFLKNILKDKENKKDSSKNPKPNALNKIRTLFIQLSKENLSQSSTFAKELSSCWVELLSSNETKIKDFCKKLHSYPKDADHSLGYYLSNYTGHDWLPFPFIEILKALYEDAIVQGEKSTLSQWISTLSEFIDTMDH